jgi:hypothetical protein
VILRPEVDAVRADIREGKEEIRGLSAEMSALSADAKELLLAELQLAKAETKEQVGFVVQMTTWGVVALIAAFITLVWVALTATAALAEAVDPWLAALIVTVALAVIAGVAALMAKSKLNQISLVPRRTVHSVKEDLTWAKHQLNLKPKSGGSAAS